ncbi:MAG: class I SAM-dependent methyltransferase [Burkholderiales bacterium]|nr:class I SAM-dependent methyltransferase [Burkholderiales bacterium]
MRIERRHDVIEGSADLEHLHTFHDFPVFMGVSDAPSSSDTLADMSFWISRASGMIQLNPLLPLDVLYPEAHGAGCVGKSWAAHHQALADFIARYEPGGVLEIGGAHGILARNYHAHRPIPWTILEPNPTPAPGCEARFIRGFFDEDFRFDGPVDAVVHSHVFEHFYDPDAFVRQLAYFLTPGKKLIFSVPYMREMLQRGYTNCLNFEHTVFLTEDYIEFLLARHGFRLLERQYFQDDHSIFYAAERDPQIHATALPEGLYERHIALYKNYLQLHQDLVDNVNAQLNADLSDQAFLFGAHVQAQYLIGFGLNIARIDRILDNDPNKHGRRLFGTDKLVAAPAVIAGLDAPIVIVRAGTFTEEIAEQLLRINPSTRLVL